MEEIKYETVTLRKSVEALMKSKTPVSDIQMAERLPLKTEEDLRSFERSCLEEKFRETVVGIEYVAYNIPIAYITFIVVVLYNSADIYTIEHPTLLKIT